MKTPKQFRDFLRSQDTQLDMMTALLGRARLSFLELQEAEAELNGEMHPSQKSINDAERLRTAVDLDMTQYFNCFKMLGEELHSTFNSKSTKS